MHRASAPLIDIARSDIQRWVVSRSSRSSRLISEIISWLLLLFPIKYVKWHGEEATGRSLPFQAQVEYGIISCWIILVPLLLQRFLAKKALNILKDFYQAYLNLTLLLGS